MSRKYPDQTKRGAIGIRQIHDDISFTRDATAVLQRALRRWREQLRKKQNSYMSEKTFQSDIKRTQNQLVAENSAETCQHAACRINRGYPPTPARIHTVSIHYAKTRVFYGYFMGICSDIRSATDGQCRRDPRCRRAVSAVCVGERCLRALRDRRSVSKGDVGGLCLRALRALRDPRC